MNTHSCFQLAASALRRQKWKWATLEPEELTFSKGDETEMHIATS